MLNSGIAMPNSGLLHADQRACMTFSCSISHAEYHQQSKRCHPTPRSPHCPSAPPRPSRPSSSAPASRPPTAPTHTSSSSPTARPPGPPTWTMCPTPLAPFRQMARHVPRGWLRSHPRSSRSVSLVCCLLCPPSLPPWPHPDLTPTYLCPCSVQDPAQLHAAALGRGD